jgi:hypothetical protein
MSIITGNFGTTHRAHSKLCRMLRMFLYISMALTPAYSWGLRGHRVVARIAEMHLSESTAEKIKEILGRDSLPKISNEPDALRSDSKWKCAAALHYVSIEYGNDYFESKRHPDGDIILALAYFEDVLRSKKESKARQRNALRWIVHLVGDLHQPLHVGRECDRGGNNVEVSWFRHKTNLHRVWDSGLIDHQELSYTELADFLNDGKLTSTKLEDSADYRAWAKETLELRPRLYQCFANDSCCADGDHACKGEAIPFGQCTAKPMVPRLGYAYATNNQDLLNRQLTVAGLRLAKLLDRIFSGSPLNKTEKALRAKLIKDRRAELDKLTTCIAGAESAP